MTMACQCVRVPMTMGKVGMRKRKFAPVVRLQVEREMLPVLRGRIAAELGWSAQRDLRDMVASAYAARR